MQIVVLGLGKFGMALAGYLAETDNEVIVCDLDMEKIDAIKDKVSHAVAMDATHLNAYQALPLNRTDIAIVAIGEQGGVNIKAAAILKKITDAKIVARSASPIEDTIFEAMKVDQIIHPEQEYAERLTKTINLRGTIDNFEIAGEYSVSEVPLCEALVGKTILESDFRKKFKLNIITIIRRRKYDNILSRIADKQEVVGMPKPDTVLTENDILVVFGRNKSIEKYLQENNLSKIK